MSDKDRKEWELTDEERTEIRAWYCGQGSISLHSRNIFCLADAFAYKGARKALEWAQDQCFASKNVYASDVLDVIRKELTDD